MSPSKLCLVLHIKKVWQAWYHYSQIMSETCSHHMRSTSPYNIQEAFLCTDIFVYYLVFLAVLKTYYEPNMTVPIDPACICYLPCFTIFIVLLRHMPCMTWNPAVNAHWIQMLLFLWTYNRMTKSWIAELLKHITIESDSDRRCNRLLPSRFECQLITMYGNISNSRSPPSINRCFFCSIAHRRNVHSISIVRGSRIHL